MEEREGQLPRELMEAKSLSDLKELVGEPTAEERVVCIVRLGCSTDIRGAGNNGARFC